MGNNNDGIQKTKKNSTKFRDILGYGLGCLVNPFVWILCLLLCSSPVWIKKAYDKIAEGNVFVSILVLTPILATLAWAIYLYFKKENLETALSEKDKLLLSKEKEHRNEIDTISNKLKSIQQENDSLLGLIKSKTPFKDVAEMESVLETFIFKKDEHFLRYKPHPAISAAAKVKEIRDKYQTSLFESKQMLYKYEFLLSVFPELKESFEDESALIHIKDNYTTLDDYNDNRDHVHDWLTDAEYKSMSVDDRNQLALDRYKKRRKDNWEIGIDYELYVGYLLREGKAPFDGRWSVVQYGEKKKLEDLGRDIIADRIGFDGKRTTYIIQCKRWSEQRIVHENAICQLFGTSVEYKIKHRELLLYDIVPVFITTTNLSPMAMEFAKQLGVKVMKIPMGDYPMIKCNINNGEKIYHLPFDQQYHRTEISKEGEFFAMTVKEASAKGFRRAMRHFAV